MLQASCIYLGLITPVRKPTTPSTCPEDLSPPAQLQVSSQQKNTQNIPPDYVSLIASTNLPISMKPPWSLSVLSLVVRPTVAPPCLNKGNLLLLRSSFLFCLAGTMPYTVQGVTKRWTWLSNWTTITFPWRPRSGSVCTHRRRKVSFRRT